ncbi:hypothetical protein [Photorhabdus bodei]
MTGVSECSQQRGNLKDDRYIPSFLHSSKKRARDLAPSSFNSPML